MNYWLRGRYTIQGRTREVCDTIAENFIGKDASYILAHLDTEVGYDLNLSSETNFGYWEIMIECNIYYLLFGKSDIVKSIKKFF